ncbi:hypothetical protein D9756_003749 [Leucocoprinus leucothites]|uniref:Peptidase S8/S53 domain-containing protein n=1 Tax=Leucocoprinus leucothites TaxID=201217 RepID=A0A8H5D952_9AGAR|nr:hypothetical protein D9756_003749 [Leucoagaricus leucothites]
MIPTPVLALISTSSTLVFIPIILNSAVALPGVPPMATMLMPMETATVLIARRGTAAGSQFGVAKSANLVAVKVLDDGGSGAISDIRMETDMASSVSGLNYVLTLAKSTGRPSIVSMSLGGGASDSLDSAVASVAAGNSNTDASTTSPARAPSAITVGAITITDARASFSNYGSVVDVFAPGQSIISAWIGSTTATNNISGTSMAAPHVAGLVAYLAAKNGNPSPADMSSLLGSLALSDALSDIRRRVRDLYTSSM